jgi:hypothetical protein
MPSREFPVGSTIFWRRCQNYQNQHQSPEVKNRISASCHGRMTRSGHGFPKVSPGPAMPYPSTPCRRATFEATLWLFHPFGHPTPYAYAFCNRKISHLQIGVLNFPECGIRRGYVWGYEFSESQTKFEHHILTKTCHNNTIHLVENIVCFPGSGRRSEGWKVDFSSNSPSV